MDELRRRDLNELQQLVARVLAPLGQVELATSCKTLRKVTLHHESGVTLRVVVGIDIRVGAKTYFVALLRVADDFNTKITRVPNFTIRGVTPATVDLEPLLPRVREAIEILAA